MKYFSRQSKPLPGMSYNYVHPLARGLGYVWAFNEYSGVPMSLRETDLSLRIPQANQAGGPGEWVGGGMLVNSGGLNGPRVHGCNWSDDAALMAHVTIESETGDNPAIFSKRNTAADAGWSVHKSGADLVLAWGATPTTITFTGGWPGTGEHVLVLTFQKGDVDTEWHLYVDGALIIGVNNASRPGFAADSIFCNFGTRFPGDTSYATMIVHTVQFWVGAALSPSDALALWNNPYEIFEFDGLIPPWEFGHTPSATRTWRGERTRESAGQYRRS